MFFAFVKSKVNIYIRKKYVDLNCKNNNQKSWVATPQEGYRSPI